MRILIYNILPWFITIVALYFAFRGIEFEALWNQLLAANPNYLYVAVVLTCSSYFFRARRWQFLFPKRVISYLDSLRVLILGFFMNNILPARTGELVRAHLGSVVTKEKRTLVLATVASERLLDGLMLSLLFAVFAIGIGSQELSRGLLLVAGMFAIATALVVIMLWQRSKVFAVLDRLQTRVNSKTTRYTSDRVQVFINGLVPLCTRSRLPIILLWTAVVWLTELAVFIVVAESFGNPLELQHAVLFLVSVNFSSLIPAAPGGLGVIEAIASAVLVSVGVEHNVALAMVMTQHFIQYVVVGVPGALVMVSWKSRLSQFKQAEHDQQAQNV